MRRFDARVLALMAHDVDVPLALSNLAARGQVSAAHIHITRHLALDGSRLTELAASAGMSKQAMGNAGRPVRSLGPGARASPTRGRAGPARACSPPPAWPGCRPSRTRWRRPKPSCAPAVGDEVATVVAIGLEAYAA